MLFDHVGVSFVYKGTFFFVKTNLLKSKPKQQTTQTTRHILTQIPAPPNHCCCPCPKSPSFKRQCLDSCLEHFPPPPPHDLGFARPSCSSWRLSCVSVALSCASCASCSSELFYFFIPRRERARRLVVWRFGACSGKASRVLQWRG